MRAVLPVFLSVRFIDSSFPLSRGAELFVIH
jgi:hypothetical protein